MAANAQITVEPYIGTEKESFRQFEQPFRGFIGVAAIPNAQQTNFLQLHLRGDALRYFQTLPEATRQDVELSLTALRDHFCNTQLQEVHILRLEQKKFDPKIDTPENFLVTLQTAAQRAYPPPNLPAVAPLANGADEAEQARFARETAARQERINAEEEFKNEQVKRIFQKAMPGWLRSKMMEQPPNTTVQELCTLARQQMTIRDLCRKDDYPEDGFNEISTTVSDNLISALSKLNATQEAMERKLSSMDDRIKKSGDSSTQRGFREQYNGYNRFFIIYAEHSVAKLPKILLLDSNQEETSIIGVTPDILDSHIPEITNRVITTQDKGNNLILRAT